MKRYRAPLGRISEVTHDHPERTASRSLPGIFGDIEFQVWSNRTAMARSIRMQEKREHRSGDWKAIVPLSPGEGR
jgi:hypothetical protein